MNAWRFQTTVQLRITAAEKRLSFRDDAVVIASAAGIFLAASRRFCSLVLVEGPYVVNLHSSHVFGRSVLPFKLLPGTPQQLLSNMVVVTPMALRTYQRSERCPLCPKTKGHLQGQVS
jgi:hypothetical protein